MRSYLPTSTSRVSDVVTIYLDGELKYQYMPPEPQSHEACESVVVDAIDKMLKLSNAHIHSAEYERHEHVDIKGNDFETWVQQCVITFAYKGRTRMYTVMYQGSYFNGSFPSVI